MSFLMPKAPAIPPPPAPELPPPPPTMANAGEFQSQRNMLRQSMTGKASENRTGANTALKTLLGQ